ncbi:MAG: DNA primase large subunit PriL [Methanocellales archaeon]
MLPFLVKYPFTTKVHEFVRQSNRKIESLLTDDYFAKKVRRRAVERILQALDGEIKKPNFKEEILLEVELYSYPIARIIISILNDPYLTRRYALAEAKAAYQYLKEEENDVLREICEDLKIKVIWNSQIYLPFPIYLHLASGIQDAKWKLVNRRLQLGKVAISKNEIARLMQEAIRRKIQNSLPLEVPMEIRKLLSSEVNMVSARLLKQKSRYEHGKLQSVEVDCFPPCMASLLRNTSMGINLPHSARFALTAFLLNIGMKVEEVIEVFKALPDFDEGKTRYQVEHISGKSGTAYTTPSCSTMATYGNCLGRDKICSSITHPLSYYRKKIEFKNKGIKELEKEKKRVEI